MCEKLGVDLLRNSKVINFNLLSYALRDAAHWLYRFHAEEIGPASIPAGGKLGFKSSLFAFGSLS